MSHRKRKALSLKNRMRLRRQTLLLNLDANKMEILMAVKSLGEFAITNLDFIRSSSIFEISRQTTLDRFGAIVVKNNVENFDALTDENLRLNRDKTAITIAKREKRHGLVKRVF